MKRFSIKQSVVMVGAVAALALGTGVMPGAANSTPTAQAAELAQHGGGHGSFQHHDGGFRHESTRKALGRTGRPHNWFLATAWMSRAKVTGRPLRLRRRHPFAALRTGPGESFGFAQDTLREVRDPS